MLNNKKRILNELLVDIFNDILSIQQQRLKESGVNLSLNEVHVLEQIEKAQDPTMSHIASKLRVTVGTLTTAVKRLVEKGYVKRYQTEEDLRKVYLKTTEQAKKVLKNHDSFHQEMIESVLEGVDETALETITESFEKLIDFFKKAY